MNCPHDPCWNAGEDKCCTCGAELSPLRQEARERLEQAAREVYWRLCPHAPKDLPIEKSTTMKAFIEGYTLGRMR